MSIDRVTVRRALVSVSDKRGLEELARGLSGLGVELVSTGGTARALESAGVAVTRVESLTGMAEMLDGRVKTRHPAVHGGILTDRETPEHMERIRAEGWGAIDLVVVNLYPFEAAVRGDSGDELGAIENIDVGGPTMLRAAAKNFRGVAVVTSPDQYEGVLDEMRAEDGATRLATRRRLAARGFSALAAYNGAIASYLSGRMAVAEGAGEGEGEGGFGASLAVVGERAAELRYGENPHQRAALYRVGESGDGVSLVDAELLSGKALSYNNLNDAAGAVRAVADLWRLGRGRAGAAVVKHTNPCGLALGGDAAGAALAALAGDPMAAFGGILALNVAVDEAAASRIVESAGFLEVVVAPGFVGGAAEMLSAKWSNVRLLAIGGAGLGASGGVQFRSVPGGILAQGSDDRLDLPGDWAHAAGPAPTEEVVSAAGVSWVAAKQLTSNAVAIAAVGVGGEPMLVGGGAGQMDRVASCEIAARKAGDRARGGVAGSDAFFPFPDGPGVLIDAGVRAIVHPGGSKRDEETFSLCDERGVTCLTTGTRHFRH